MTTTKRRAKATSKKKSSSLGRAPLYDEPQGRYSITLPEHIEKYLRKVGEGNLSQGIRALVERRVGSRR